MFGVDTGELFIIILVAVVVIGPKDLPRVMRSVGQWVGKARGMANQFRSGVDQMMRESEIADLEKKWREQNEAIMRAHPLGGDSDWGLSAPAGDQPAAVSLDKPAAAAPAPPPAADPVPVTVPRQSDAPAPARAQPPGLVPLPIKPAAVAPRTAGQA